MEIAVRLVLAIPFALLLGGLVVFSFSLITSITNLAALGLAKIVRSLLRLSGSSPRVATIGREVSELTKGLIAFFLMLAIAWLAFITFGLDSGPDLYTVFSTIAAALAVLVWAPTIFVVGLLTGERRESEIVRSGEEDDCGEAPWVEAQVHFDGCDELHAPGSSCNGQVATRPNR